jgi:hypothetical protein
MDSRATLTMLTSSSAMNAAAWLIPKARQRPGRLALPGGSASP